MMLVASARADAHDEAGRRPRSPELLAQLTDGARFSRLQAVRLAQIAGAGHYSGAFSAATLRRSLDLTPRS